jgi:hypothetical protein
MLAAKVGTQPEEPSFLPVSGRMHAPASMPATKVDAP